VFFLIVNFTIEHMNKTHSDNEVISIRDITSRYVFFVLLITLAISAGSFLVYRDYLLQQHQNEQMQNVNKKADTIGNVIRIYRQTIEARSRQRDLVNYILFSEEVEAKNWAQRAKPILPKNIGLALFDEEGKLLGDTENLRVGDLCLIDLRRIFKGEKLPAPPVHRNVKGIEHFDIVVPLFESTEIVGVVFASFSLELIKEELNRITDVGQYLSVMSFDNYLIAETNRIEWGDKPVLDFDVDIPGTSWVLRAKVEEQDMSELLQRLGIINMLVFLAVSFVMVVFSRRLFKIFSHDFDAIHNLIFSLKNDDEAEKSSANLKETKYIFDHIKLIAGDIKKYQFQLLTLSNTDSLTGLANRRSFNHEIPRYLALSNRDIDVCLLLIDVDHFKKINDSFGHGVGDDVLMALSRCIKTNTREVDFSARLGGDEFSVVLTQCSAASALKWYKKLSADFLNAQMEMRVIKELGACCTLSVGFVLLTGLEKNVDQLVACADEALYSVKSKGRGDIKQYSENKNLL